MASTIKPFDVYGNTQTLDDAIIDVMAKRLESRGKHPVFLQLLHDYLYFMDVDS